ncbi:ATP synthase F1, delta subunit, partial [gut metagenome]
MTQTARIYGGSLYDLAVEEKLTETILEQMEEVRRLFQEIPDYIRLLSEPSLPKNERTKLIDEAFGKEAEKYLVNFLKLLCERDLLREYAGCCEEFKRRYNVDHHIAEA